MTRTISRAEFIQRVKDKQRDRQRKRDAEYIPYHRHIAEKCRKRRHKKQ